MVKGSAKISPKKISSGAEFADLLRDVQSRGDKVIAVMQDEFLYPTELRCRTVVLDKVQPIKVEDGEYHVTLISSGHREETNTISLLASWRLNRIMDLYIEAS